MTNQQNVNVDLPIDDAALVLQLDLAESYRVTSSYKETNNPAYVEGFVFGIGSVHFRRSSGSLEILLGGQQLGNFFVFLDQFENCINAVNNGQREVAKICSAGQVRITLDHYHKAIEEENCEVLCESDYQLLLRCTVESTYAASISCYTVNGLCFLEVSSALNQSLSEVIPFVWFREVIPETMLENIKTSRAKLLEAYATFSAAQRAR